MILDLLDRLKFNLKKIAILLIFIFFLVSPITRSFYYLINYKYDNRLLGAVWINENIDKGKKITLSFPPTNWNSLPFNFNNYILLDKENLDADYIVLVNEKLNNKFESKFSIIEFHPSIVGYRPVLKGEVMQFMQSI